jgi:putative ABC transport system permease protein
MRQIFYLVRQNFKRKPFRTWIMIAGIVLACATLFSAAVLSGGIRRTLQTAGDRLGADIVVVPADAGDEALSALISGNPTVFYMPSSLQEKVGETPGVERTCAQVYLRSLDAACCVVQVALVGFDPERDFTLSPWVLQKTREPLRDNQLIVGAKVISSVVGTPAKAIGQRLMFMGKPFIVATILEPTGLGTDYTVFLTMNMAYQMTQDSPLYPVPVKKDQISTILVKLSEGVEPEAAAKNIERNIPEVKAYTALQLTRSLNRQLQNLVDGLFVAGSMFSILALVLVGSLFALSVRQRTRELGLFMAMGARRAVVFKLVMLEAVFVAGAGGLLGVLIGFSVTYFSKDLITEMIGNLYMWPGDEYFLQIALVGLCASLVTGMLGGLYPALRISRFEPYEAIRAV